VDDEEWSDPALDGLVPETVPVLPRAQPLRPHAQCQCTDTTGCPCLPCPEELDEEDLLCSPCRAHKKEGRVTHCHRAMARLRLAKAVVEKLERRLDGAHD
jgi:hypothetical protein